MSEMLSTTCDIARAAGAILMEFFERRVRVEYKGDVDIVTEADRTSEKYIISQLREKFPEHSVIAEEGGGYERASGYAAGYTWYIDPLDGTTNFAHSFPVFAVSMGLKKDDEMVLGVVYDPTRNEMFAAEKGQGATLNGKPMRVSSIARLAEALVATGFPSQRRHQNPNIHFYHQFNMNSHGVRRPGSAATDLAYVAAGRLDAFWEFNLHPWDVAAGKLLVAEAGGRVSDSTGAPHTMQSNAVMASNGLLHDQMLKEFNNLFAGKYAAALPPLVRPA
ncbi:MAG: inositol monophosphatase [Acidobacteria bacterium]|nr:inositol monophosphatase [Acidobacteriota bacterium]